MNMQRIDLMGPEYVVMLGVWWGVAVILTVLVMATRRAFARRGRLHAGKLTRDAAG
jgi:hypothetical protein